MSTFQLLPDVNVGCRDGTYDEIVFRESWRDDQYRMTTLPLPNGAWALDLGANVGAWTILAREAGARVMAVECWAGNVRRLELNLAMTGTESQTFVVEAAAVGHHTDRVYLDNIGEVTQVDVQTHDDAGDDRPSVKAVHIDDLLMMQQRWWCLKCDIEGGEYDVFKGVTPGLLNRVDYLTMEFHGRGMGQHLDWIDDDQFGALITKLCDWGNITTMGRASIGGNIFGHRYGVDAPILGAERVPINHWLNR